VKENFARMDCVGTIHASVFSYKMILMRSEGSLTNIDNTVSGFVK
jgi:hypothetical protein